MLYDGPVRVDENAVAGEALLRVELYSPVHRGVPTEIPITLRTRVGNAGSPSDD